MINGTAKNKTLFSKELWMGGYPMYARILEHPFIVELAEGTLSRARFVHYLQQDDLYLIDFARALAYIAARVKEPCEMVSFLKFSLGALVGERELHEDYFRHYKIAPANKKNAGCFAYTHYLISVVTLQSVETAVAAVLPCFWVYHEVGAHIFSNSVRDNPYERWINTYSNEMFSLLVSEALEIAERMYELASSDVRQAMRKAAQESVYLEWQFWDEAYQLKAL